MWARLEYPEKTFHVIPVGDWRVHECTECWCKPIEKEKEGETIMSHNAADGRHIKEGH